MTVIGRFLFFFFLPVSLLILALAHLQSIQYPSIDQVYSNLPKETTFVNHDPKLIQFKNVTLTFSGHEEEHLSKIRLNIMEGGENNEQLVVLLHGFPETAKGTWGGMIDYFVRDGYHVIAPDMRGYNTSQKPTHVSSYGVQHLVNDVRLLITEYAKKDNAIIVSHDWGSIVTWKLIEWHPELIKKAVVAVPHPDLFLSNVGHYPRQLLKSWYILYFQLRGLVERNLERNDYSVLFHFAGFHKLAQKGLISKEEALSYVRAWSLPGELTSMLNYYRQLFMDGLKKKEVKKITVPTMVVHGLLDGAIELNATRFSYETAFHEDTKNYCRFTTFNSSHWITKEVPDLFYQEIKQFIQDHQDDEREMMRYLADRADKEREERQENERARHEYLQSLKTEAELRIEASRKKKLIADREEFEKKAREAQKSQ